MLARYLKELRASKVVSSSQALSTLGSGWSEGQGGAIEKQFTFDDFTQASNFMERYTEYCHKVNGSPEWSNVYNRVSVRLHSSEFDGVTTKEVNMGRYLDLVSKVTVNQDVEDVLQLEQVAEKAQLDRPSLHNDQNQRTSLYLTQ